MGGFFGVVSNKDCVVDLFFGLDYHSHLGTRYGGMVIHDQANGFQRQIHSIEPESFLCSCLSAVQFSHSVMSDSLQPHGLQHARPACPSPTPGVYPDSCPKNIINLI